MAYLVADRTYDAYGLKINEYLLTKHNPNEIAMPTYNLPNKIVGITIHNTQSIDVSAQTTMAEQYTRATVNGNMGRYSSDGVRVHFYVDDKCGWQNLPLTLCGWHAADGNGDGNRKTIAIECIMDGQSGSRNEAAEENTARLTAYLLDKYGLTSTYIYSHSHWYSGKTCPLYILPHWNTFIKKVEKYMKGSASTQSTAPTTTLYRVRKSWNDTRSQIGAYRNLDSAKAICTDGYFIFDESGAIVYPLKSTNELSVIKKGDKGSKVKAVQILLAGYGYDLSPYGCDGDFGNLTETRLKEFQIKQGIKTTGVVDSDTWNKLLGG